MSERLSKDSKERKSTNSWTARELELLKRLLDKDQIDGGEVAEIPSDQVQEKFGKIVTEEMKGRGSFPLKDFQYTNPHSWKKAWTIQWKEERVHEGTITLDYDQELYQAGAKIKVDVPFEVVQKKTVFQDDNKRLFVFTNNQDTTSLTPASFSITDVVSTVLEKMPKLFNNSKDEREKRAIEHLFDLFSEILFQQHFLISEGRKKITANLCRISAEAGLSITDEEIEKIVARKTMSSAPAYECEFAGIHQTAISNQEAHALLKDAGSVQTEALTEEPHLALLNPEFLKEAAVIQHINDLIIKAANEEHEPTKDDSLLLLHWSYYKGKKTTSYFPERFYPLLGATGPKHVLIGLLPTPFVTQKDIDLQWYAGVHTILEKTSTHPYVASIVASLKHYIALIHDNGEKDTKELIPRGDFLSMTAMALLKTKEFEDILERNAPLWWQKFGDNLLQLANMRSRRETDHIGSRFSQPLLALIDELTLPGLVQAQTVGKSLPPLFALLHKSSYDTQGGNQPSIATALEQSIHTLLKSPLWQSLISPSALEQIMPFLYWMKDEAIALKNQKPIEQERVLQSFAQMLMHDKRLEQYKKILSYWLEEALLTLMYARIWQHAEALGETWLLAKETPNEIILSADTKPVHLIMSQADEYAKMLDSINSNLLLIQRKVNDSKNPSRADIFSYDEKMSTAGAIQRIGHVLVYLCLLEESEAITSFSDENNTAIKKLDKEQQKFLLELATHADLSILQSWFKTYGLAEKIEEGKSDNETSKFQFYNQVGADFMQWYVENTQAVLANLRLPNARDSYQGSMQQIIAIAATVQQVMIVGRLQENENWPWVNENQQALKIITLLHESIMTLQAVSNFLESYIIFNQGSELAISPGSVIVLLGPNMHGKSTVLRSLVYAWMSYIRGLPQAGTVSMSEFPIDASSPIGDLTQSARGSLLTQLIPGLNELAKPRHGQDQNTPEKILLQLFDELGRQTNEEYGLAILITAIIFAIKKSQSNTLPVVISTTHYHEIANLAPLFDMLGIPLVVKIVKEYKLHDYHPDEQTRSEAIAALARYIPHKTLREFWPEQNDMDLITGNEKESKTDKTTQPSRGDLFNHTKNDLVTEQGPKSFDYSVKTFMHASGFTNDVDIAKIIYDSLLNPNNAVEMQKLIAESHENIEVFNSWKSSAELLYELMNNVPSQEDPRREKIIDKLYEENKNHFPDDIMKSLQAAGKRINQVYPDFISEILFNQFTKNLLEKDRATTNQLQRLLAFAAIIDRFKPGDGVCKVSFQDGVVSLGEMVAQSVDDSLPTKGPQITNSADYRFNGELAGEEIKGENHAGKSVYARTLSWCLVLGLSFGFTFAESCILDPNLVLLGLTEPTTDDLDGNSGMASEVKNRIAPIISTIQQATKENPVLIITDEIGSKTSPADILRIELMLYRIAASMKGKALLVNVTHSMNLQELLRADGLQVESCAFVHEGPHKYKRLKGNEAQQHYNEKTGSNAIEVMLTHKLDPDFGKVAQIVYTIIQQLHDGKTIETILEETSLAEIEALFS